MTIIIRACAWKRILEVAVNQSPHRNWNMLPIQLLSGLCAMVKSPEAPKDPFSTFATQNFEGKDWAAELKAGCGTHASHVTKKSHRYWRSNHSFFPLQPASMDPSRQNCLHPSSPSHYALCGEVVSQSRLQNATSDLHICHRYRAEGTIFDRAWCTVSCCHFTDLRWCSWSSPLWSWNGMKTGLIWSGDEI